MHRAFLSNHQAYNCVRLFQHSILLASTIKIHPFLRQSRTCLVWKKLLLNPLHAVSLTLRPLRTRCFHGFHPRIHSIIFFMKSHDLLRCRKSAAERRSGYDALPAGIASLNVFIGIPRSLFSDSRQLSGAWVCHFPGDLPLLSIRNHERLPGRAKRLLKGRTSVLESPTEFRSYTSRLLYCSFATTVSSNSKLII